MLIERAARELDLKVCSLWGMTESLSSTLTEPARAAEKSSSTDGRPLEGVDVKIVGDDSETLPAGKTGRLLVRGAQLFAGYYKRPDIVTFDAEGWFDSGDLAYMDAEGYIRINGRTKDVLIRGGENVPEIGPAPSAPGVAAIVGYPEASGERLRLRRSGARRSSLLPTSKDERVQGRQKIGRNGSRTSCRGRRRKGSVRSELAANPLAGEAGCARALPRVRQKVSPAATPRTSVGCP